MKLKYDFTIMDMGGEFAAVPVGDDAAKFRGMLKLNAVSAEIMKALAEETDIVTLHRKLKEKYPESDDGEIGNVLAPFINRLLAEGLLID